MRMHEVAVSEVTPICYLHTLINEYEQLNENKCAFVQTRSR